MTVAELGRRMSSAEFREWMAYAYLEPFGPLRDDQRAGTVAAMVLNVNRDAKKRREPYTWETFFPTADITPPPQMSVGQKVMAWADAHNAMLAARQKPS